MKPAASFYAWTVVTGLLLMLTLFSCKKDPYEIGFDILPPKDTLGIAQTDTVTVVAYSILVDSTRSDETTTNIIGGLMDPVFGKTTGDMFTQVRLSDEGIDFGINPELDSLVLVLYYTGYYGDTNTTQNVKVYEISQDLYQDSTYYSNQVAGHYGTLLADLDFKPRPGDSITLWGEKAAPQLRINLSERTKYLGTKLLEAPTSVLASNTEFVKFMKGLAVISSPVSDKGALISVATGGGTCKMVAYFHNQTEGQGDSLHYDFKIDSKCARFNHFDHYGYQDASPEFRQQVLNKDTALGHEALYLQATGGTAIKLRMPYLKSFAHGKKIAVNNAQLFFYDANPESDLTPPNTLSLVMLDTAGKVSFTADQSESGSYFGGAYDTATHGYYFRLTRHVQDMLTYDTVANPYLYIYATNPEKSILYIDRALINGTVPTNPDLLGKRMKMKVIYTILQ